MLYLCDSGGRVPPLSQRYLSLAERVTELLLSKTCEREKIMKAGRNDDQQNTDVLCQFNAKVSSESIYNCGTDNGVCGDYGNDDYPQKSH